MKQQKDQAETLIIELRQLLPEIQSAFHVDTLEVFGSYMRAEQDISSDLDILVTFTETPSLFTFIALENHLADSLGIKVDLVMKDALKPAIGERILKEAVMV